MRALLCLALLSACGGSAGDPDAGREDGGADAGKVSDGGADAGRDAAPASLDASSDAGGDAGSVCPAMDAAEGRPCGPAETPRFQYLWNGRDCEPVGWCRCDGAACDELFDTLDACESAYGGCLGEACSRDDQCAEGAEWCLDGRCRACDNSGLTCRIACPDGWSTYVRHGCSPCECAPPNECASDLDCSDGRTCYPGAFCWCSPAEPGCCQGNVCSPSGCEEPSPVGCRVRGCPVGETCDRDECASSSCECAPHLDPATWSCTRDCLGGVCVPG